MLQRIIYIINNYVKQRSFRKTISAFLLVSLLLNSISFANVDIVASDSEVTENVVASDSEVTENVVEEIINNQAENEEENTENEGVAINSNRPNLIYNYDESNSLYGSADEHETPDINYKKKYINNEVIIIKKNQKVDTNLFGSSDNSDLSDIRDLLSDAELVYKTNSGNEANDESDSTDLFGLGSANNDNSSSVLYLHSDLYSTEQLISKLSKLPEVLSVEPNNVYDFSKYYVNNKLIQSNNNLLGTAINEEKINSQIDNNTLYGDAPSSDLTDKQWSLKEGTGDYQYSIKVASWNDTSHKNTEGIVVAVVDDGIDLNHPDLKNVIWSDGDIYPTTLGGGKYGFNAVANTNNNDNNYVSTDPSEDPHRNHGTHVAGIIAAEWNNFGISGICNGAKILPIRVMNQHNNGSNYSGVLAYKYLIELKKQGVNITCVNNSWGGYYDNLALKLMVEEAGKYGIATVWASGNDAKDVDAYPDGSGALRDVDCAMAIDCSDKDGVMAEFSNYGKKTTDVAAPGYDIMSCVITDAKSFNNLVTGVNPIYEQNFMKGHENEGFFPANVVEPGEKVEFDEFLYSKDDSGYINFKVSTTSSAYVKFVSNGFSTSDLANSKLYLSYAVCPPKNVWVEYETIIPCNECDASGTIIDTSIIDIKIATASYFARNEEYDYPYVDLKGIYPYNDSGVTRYYKPYLGNNTTNKFYFWVGTKGFNDTNKLEKSSYSYSIGNMGIYKNDPVEYNFMSGTSMACPTACGALAVISKTFNTATPSEWIALLKGSTDEGADELPSGHKGRLITIDNCMSGGIINLKDAIDEKNRPVVNYIRLLDNSTDYWKYEIGGFFFGDTVSDIKIHGKSYASSVTSWSERSIIFETNDNIGGGASEVRVYKPGNIWGRNFFNIDENLNNNTFASLPLYNGLSEADIFLFKSSELKDSVATGSYAFFLTYSTNDYYSLFKYDINNKQWAKTSMNILGQSFNSDYYSFASNLVERDGCLYAILFKTRVVDRTYSVNSYMLKYDIASDVISYIDLQYSDDECSYIDSTTLFVDNDDNKTLLLFGGEAYDSNKAEDYLCDAICVISESGSTWTVSPTNYKLAKNIMKVHVTEIGKDSLGNWCVYLAGGKTKNYTENKEYNDYSIIKVIFNEDNSMSSTIYENICTSLQDVIVDNIKPLYISVKNGFYLVSGFDGNGKNTYKFDVPKLTVSGFGNVTLDTATFVIGDSYNDKAYVLVDSVYSEGIRVFKTFNVEDFDPEVPDSPKPYTPSSGGSGGGGGGGSVGLEFQNDTELPTNNPNEIVAFDQNTTFEFNPLFNGFRFAKKDANGNVSYIIDKWVCHTDDKGNKSIYLTDTFGFMVTGFVMKNKKLYYMSTDNVDYGKMKTGFVKINNQTYYFDKNGRFADDPSKAPITYKVLD